MARRTGLIRRKRKGARREMKYGQSVSWIDDVLWLARQEGSDVFDDNIHQSGSRGARGPGEVRCDEAVLGTEQGIVGRRRFGGEHIESRSGEIPGIERVGEVLFDDERAATGVDEER